MESVDLDTLVLLLMETEGIGEKTLGEILRRNAVLRTDPSAFLSIPASELAERYSLPSATAGRIAGITAAKRQCANETARALRRAGVSFWTSLDASYPARLAERMEDPPPVLFAYGNPAALDHRILAVANSNGAPEAALAAGDRIVESAVERGWTIATGHNRIGYQRPALAARRNGGSVCYVLDRGIQDAFGDDLTAALFPAARIWGPAYDSLTDLTLSPFHPKAHGIAANNRRRDALLFALADQVFAGWVRTGGVMHQMCEHTLSSGRPVWLLVRESPSYEALFHSGARPLDTADSDQTSKALASRLAT